MISAWTKHLKTDDEKERFNNKILGSKSVLDRLQDLMKEEIDALESVELSNKVYDLPNWDYRQAHANGFKAYHRMLMKLTTLDQGKQDGRQPI